MSISREDFEDNWRVQLGSLTREFNKLRHECFNKMSLYYRQSPYSDYVTESELIEMLKNLDILRSRLKKLSKDNYPDTSGVLYKLPYENQLFYSIESEDDLE